MPLRTMLSTPAWMRSSPWCVRKMSRVRPPRVGSEWSGVGVTEKYYNLTLEVYRLRRGDLDMPTLNVED
jgi:hypothetical protein